MRLTLGVCACSVSVARRCRLISASTDGRVCIWDVDQMQQPIDMLDLRIALSIVSNYTSVNISTDKKVEASVTSFAIHRKENKELYIGTEAGKLYATKLDQQKTAKGTAGASVSDSSSGIDALAADKQAKGGFNASGVAREVIVNAVSKEGSHFGPVTAMHFNPLLPGHRDGLLLTASLDSMVKLWSTEHPHHEPVLSFEPSSEYICDVRWSSIHPALFAVADGSGTVSIWNIIRDTEVPVVEAKIGSKALNKIRWAADGKSLIIGDADGKSYVYEVPSEVRACVLRANLVVSLVDLSPSWCCWSRSRRLSRMILRCSRAKWLLRSRLPRSRRRRKPSRVSLCVGREVGASAACIDWGKRVWCASCAGADVIEAVPLKDLN